MDGLRFGETLWQDARYALRLLRASPGFAFAAILSLGLGIGANTAVFSVVHTVLMRPMPYPQPDELAFVSQTTNKAVSVREYEFCRDHAPAFASVAAYRAAKEVGLSTGKKQEWVFAMPVSTAFFRTLGVAPALGREFTTEETRQGGAQRIVITDSLWRRSFGGQHDVIGHVVSLADTPVTILGVLPPNFWFPQNAEVFVPLRATGRASDEGANTTMIARLQHSVSIRQAQAGMSVLSESFRQANTGRSNRDYPGMTLISLQEWLVGDVRTNLLMLFGSVGLLLLIACLNLASLLVARMTARQKEIAIRMALGSTSSRMLRQFLIENVILCLGGSAAGLAAAFWVVKGLVALLPFKLPSSTPPRVDLPVLGFTLAVAVAIGALFAMAPFFSSARLDLQESLKSGGRSSGSGGTRQRLRSALVISEVAVSVTLLIGAALMIRTLYRLHQEQLGFRPDGLITFWTPPPTEHHRNPVELQAFETSLLQRVRTLPGVTAVAASSVLPLTDPNNYPTQREGHPEQSLGGMELRIVTPAYFATLGIPVRRGRVFADEDNSSAPPVVLINETLARRWWPNGDPLGDRVVVGRFKGEDSNEMKIVPRVVVGVVADTKTVYLKEPPRPTVYLAAAQAFWYDGGMAWVVRTNSTIPLGESLRQTAMDIDRYQRLTRMRSMNDIVASETTDTRFDAWLFGIFAGLALSLTIVGVYALLAFSVAKRTKEIGTRMALGASRTAVLGVVLKQGIVLIGIGLVIGAAGALALTRSLAKLLFGIGTTDPVSFALVGVLLLAVGALASYIPARRASRVDPIIALRYE